MGYVFFCLDSISFEMFGVIAGWFCHVLACPCHVWNMVLLDCFGPPDKSTKTHQILLGSIPEVIELRTTYKMEEI